MAFVNFLAGGGAGFPAGAALEESVQKNARRGEIRIEPLANRGGCVHASVPEKNRRPDQEHFNPEKSRWQVQLGFSLGYMYDKFTSRHSYLPSCADAFLSGPASHVCASCFR